VRVATDVIDRDSTRRPVAAPPQWLTWAEGRAVPEFWAFLAASPLLRIAGRGDRHPVLVLPGFTAGDASTRPLRAVLRSQGYWVHGWDLGRNIGPTNRIIRGIDQRLVELHARHGRTVSIIGWSLGGIYARALARQHPDMVRQVITLGSPFRIAPGDRSAASALFDRLTPAFSQEFLDRALTESESTPLPVPSTAIYSKGDGIVRWHTCIDVVDDRHENIEVRGSHSGLGWNPAALGAITDRLARREGNWKPFRPLPWYRPYYPTPEDWHPR
jgi:pimeloyl-ACP methyl ester carboxylesterase